MEFLVKNCKDRDDACAEALALANIYVPQEGGTYWAVLDWCEDEEAKGFIVGVTLEADEADDEADDEGIQQDEDDSTVYTMRCAYAQINLPGDDAIVTIDERQEDKFVVEVNTPYFHNMKLEIPRSPK